MTLSEVYARNPFEYADFFTLVHKSGGRKVQKSYGGRGFGDEYTMEQVTFLDGTTGTEMVAHPILICRNAKTDKIVGLELQGKEGKLECILNQSF